MRVIVHGGMQKAGSSAVQAYLDARRTELAGAGIDYPDFGHRGHWPVSAAFVANPDHYHQANRRKKGRDKGQGADEVRAAVAERIGRTDEQTDVLILSHEDLSVAATAKRVDRFVDEHGQPNRPARFVAYVRDPVSMYPSAIQQAMKSKRSRELLPSDWVCSHSQRTTRLKAAVGERALLKLFAPPGTSGWDVIDDFREVCGELLDRALPARGDIAEVNTSFSAQACAVLELGRSSELSHAVVRYLPRLCRWFDPKSTRTKLRVPEEWKCDIAARNAAAWNEALALLDCSDEQKRAARLTEGTVTRTYTDADIAGWLIGGLDAAWCEQFAAFCRNKDLPNNAPLRLSRWIERDVLPRAARG